jgi:hypothetical protein
MSNTYNIVVTGQENKKLVPSDILVLQICDGGLGDHLFLSHIPRIAKETGKYNKVFISNMSTYKSSLYKALVWDSNPYIDGFTDNPGWYPEIPETFPGTNLLDMNMLGHGLDDGIRFHEPEIYYVPKIKAELKNKVIYDPNFIANAGRIGIKELDKFFNTPEQLLDFQMYPRNKTLLVNNIPYLKSDSLEEYCSIIVSCKKFYCLTSGSATLAAALKKNAVVLYGERVKRKFHHSRLHNYIFIKPDKKDFFTKISRKLKSYLK